MERKKLISIPLWVIMLFVLMAISVGVIINGLFFAEPVVTDKETNYVDDKLLGTIQAFENAIVNEIEKTEAAEESDMYINTITDPGVAKTTEDEAKALLTKYIGKYSRFENNNVGVFPELLILLGLETEDNINLLMNSSNAIYSKITTNVKYDDFKREMLKMMTEDYFNEVFSNYENDNGYVVVDNGAGGYAPLEFSDLKCISYDDDTLTYVYDVKVKDVEVYDSLVDGESEDAFFDVTVTLVRVDDLLVIDNIE